MRYLPGNAPPPPELCSPSHAAEARAAAHLRVAQRGVAACYQDTGHAWGLWAPPSSHSTAVHSRMGERAPVRGPLSAPPSSCPASRAGHHLHEREKRGKQMDPRVWGSASRHCFAPSRSAAGRRMQMRRQWAAGGELAKTGLGGGRTRANSPAQAQVAS